MSGLRPAMAHRERSQGEPVGILMTPNTQALEKELAPYFRGRVPIRIIGPAVEVRLALGSIVRVDLSVGEPQAGVWIGSRRAVYVVGFALAVLGVAMVLALTSQLSLEGKYLIVFPSLLAMMLVWRHGLELILVRSHVIRWATAQC